MNTPYPGMPGPVIPGGPKQERTETNTSMGSRDAFGRDNSKNQYKTGQTRYNGSNTDAMNFPEFGLVKRSGGFGLPSKSLLPRKGINQNVLNLDPFDEGFVKAEQAKRRYYDAIDRKYGLGGNIAKLLKRVVIPPHFHDGTPRKEIEILRGMRTLPTAKQETVQRALETVVSDQLEAVKRELPEEDGDMLSRAVFGAKEAVMDRIDKTWQDLNTVFRNIMATNSSTQGSVSDGTTTASRATESVIQSEYMSAAGSVSADIFTDADQDPRRYEGAQVGDRIGIGTMERQVPGATVSLESGGSIGDLEKRFAAFKPETSSETSLGPEDYLPDGGVDFPKVPSDLERRYKALGKKKEGTLTKEEEEFMSKFPSLDGVAKGEDLALERRVKAAKEPIPINTQIAAMNPELKAHVEELLSNLQGQVESKDQALKGLQQELANAAAAEAGDPMDAERESDFTKLCTTLAEALTGSGDAQVQALRETLVGLKDKSPQVARNIVLAEAAAQTITPQPQSATGALGAVTVEELSNAFINTNNEIVANLAGPFRGFPVKPIDQQSDMGFSQDPTDDGPWYNEGSNYEGPPPQRFQRQPSFYQQLDHQLDATPNPLRDLVKRASEELALMQDKYMDMAVQTIVASVEGAKISQASDNSFNDTFTHVMKELGDGQIQAKSATLIRVYYILKQLEDSGEIQAYGAEDGNRAQESVLLNAVRDYVLAYEDQSLLRKATHKSGPDGETETTKEFHSFVGNKISTPNTKKAKRKIRGISDLPLAGTIAAGVKRGLSDAISRGNSKRAPPPP